MRSMIAFGLVIWISGTAAASQFDPGPERTEAALGFLRQKLKDPASAQIDAVAAGRNEKLVKHGTGVCGYVNARNSYGGYEGRRAFAVFLDAELQPVSADIANDFPSEVLVQSYCQLWGIPRN